MSSKTKRVGDGYIHFLLYCSVNYIVKIASLTRIGCSYGWMDIAFFDGLHTND